MCCGHSRANNGNGLRGEAVSHAVNVLDIHALDPLHADALDVAVYIAVAGEIAKLANVAQSFAGAYVPGRQRHQHSRLVYRHFEVPH